MYSLNFGEKVDSECARSDVTKKKNAPKRKVTVLVFKRKWGYFEKLVPLVSCVEWELIRFLPVLAIKYMLCGVCWITRSRIRGYTHTHTHLTIGDCTELCGVFQNVVATIDDRRRRWCGGVVLWVNFLYLYTKETCENLYVVVYI